ncbi:MAG: hypothetical protein AAGA64_13070 [Bacteroidota bacterium]
MNYIIPKASIVILFTLISNYVRSQEIEKYSDALTKSVCSLDEPVNPKELTINNQPLEASSDLYEYLNELKSLFKQRFAKYNIRVISTKKTAAAHYQLIGNDVARVITINESYYENIAEGIDKEALMVWILAHEFSHHVHGDITYDQDGIVANNLTKEILADNRAGYAVGKLTNADLSFFKEFLPKILSVNKYSNTHPPLTYRLFASQMGWVEAKNEESDLSEEFVHSANSSSEYFLWKRESNPNMLYEIWNDGDLYFGEAENTVASGDGFTVFFDGATELRSVFFGKNDGKVFNGTVHRKSGDRYIGRKLLNNERIWQRDGYGSYYFRSGKIYRGLWKDNEKHGQGVLYEGKEVIQSGCWQDGEYIGENCN